MEVLLWISGIAFGVFILVYIIRHFTMVSRKQEIKDWEVGDLIIINGDHFSKLQLLKKNNKEYAVLQGWTLDELFLSFGDSRVHTCNWNILTSNKSAVWRRNVKNCESVMGKKPGFDSVVTDNNCVISDNISVNDTVDGKPISLLTEIECQVYLKQFIDKENYVMAEKIQKQMEKYR